MASLWKKYSLNQDPLLEIMTKHIYKPHYNGKLNYRQRKVRYRYLRRAHRASFKNEESILRSTVCGCFSCMATFPPSDVALIPEMDGKRTAWCPHCNIDAVLGDATGYPITPEFLKEMKGEWFGY